MFYPTQVFSVCSNVLASFFFLILASHFLWRLGPGVLALPVLFVQVCTAYSDQVGMNTAFGRNVWNIQKNPTEKRQKCLYYHYMAANDLSLHDVLITLYCFRSICLSYFFWSGSVLHLVRTAGTGNTKPKGNIWIIEDYRRQPQLRLRKQSREPVHGLTLHPHRLSRGDGLARPCDVTMSISGSTCKATFHFIQQQGLWICLQM